MSVGEKIMTKKVYAVRKGKKTGLYTTWAECQKQISGFSGAEFKGFATVEEAKAYLQGGEAEKSEELPQTEAVAYVDGSYQNGLQKFSCGVVFFYQGEELHFSKLFEDKELAEMRNVAGEIKGSELAIQYCLDHHIKSITIFHDYEGIAKWCTGAWEAKKAGTQSYRDFYQKAREQVEIHFVKVKGHSGDKYNELADQLAKAAFL